MESSLKTKLNDDLKQALRGGDSLRCSVIRMLLSAMNYSEIARQATLTDSDILGIIAKEIKQRKESIEAYKSANRPELAAKEEAEMAILKAYLPEQMSRDEIMSLVKKIIAETGAVGPRDKNKVMPKLMPMVKGKADGQEVNAVVNELLGG
ncbi:MAG: GatB/YqeY domain-containing protein [Dehalococcoidia bacterium]|nr:MAG: GatB/YqeY domain-containing protein [Dehalococcoidia bacterium]